MAKKRKNTALPRLNFDVLLDYHGYTAEKALYELEEALYLHTGRSVLVIHGRGGGVLKLKIREFLRTSQLPVSVEFGEELNLPGGDGVTAVYL